MGSNCSASKYTHITNVVCSGVGTCIIYTEASLGTLDQYYLSDDGIVAHLCLL